MAGEFSLVPIEMTPAAAGLVLLGMILSLSIFADAVANRLRVPRISLLVLVGVGVV